MHIFINFTIKPFFFQSCTCYHIPRRDVKGRCFSFFPSLRRRLFIVANKSGCILCVWVHGVGLRDFFIRSRRAQIPVSRWCAEVLLQQCQEVDRDCCNCPGKMEILKPLQRSGLILQCTSHNDIIGSSEGQHFLRAKTVHWMDKIREIIGNSNPGAPGALKIRFHINSPKTFSFPQLETCQLIGSWVTEIQC